MDLSHTATCLTLLRKDKDISTFLQLVMQHFVAVVGCKTGVLHVKSFLQRLATFVARQVARKIAPRNMALSILFRHLFNSDLIHTNSDLIHTKWSYKTLVQLN